MKKKGFTLIELLAVIIILAIIALITVPVVINAIDEANKQAFKTDMQSIIRSYEYKEVTDGTPFGEVEICSLDVTNCNFNGTVLRNENDEIIIKNITDGNYCAYGTLNNLQILEGSCGEEDYTAPIISNLTFSTTTSSITAIASFSEDGIIKNVEFSLLDSNGNIIKPYERYDFFSNNNNIMVAKKTFTGLITGTTYKVEVKVTNNSLHENNSTTLIGTVTLPIFNAPVITYNKNEWGSSKDVIITYDSGLNNQYRIIDDRLNPITTWKNVSENETININKVNYTIQARSSDGVTTFSTSEQIEKIDIVKPLLTISSNNINWSNVDGITLSMSDDLSGIDSYCVINSEDISLCNWIAVNNLLNVDTEYIFDNVGTYMVYAKDLAGNISLGKEVVVNKAAGSVTAPTTKTLTYNGSAQALVNIGSSSTGTIQYKLEGGSYSTTIPTGTNAGNYKVYYKVVGDNNHLDVAESSINVTINKATGSVNAPTAKTLTYNGSAQALVNIGSSSTGTIQYKLEGGSYSTSIPTGTNAGSYKVYYKVVGDSNHLDVAESSINVTINKASNTLALSSNTGTVTYPNAGTFTITSNVSGGTLSCESSNNNAATCSISGSTVTVTPGTQAANVTLTIKSQETSNYNAGQVAYTLVSQNGVLSYTANNYSGTYDGSSHTISVTSSGSTIKYGTSSGSYTLTSAPTYTNAGTYTVYYQITKAGYVTVTGSKTISIAKKSISIAATSQSKEYNGSALSADSTCSVSSGSLISGQSYACTSTGSQTSVGSSTKTLSTVVIKSGSTDVTSNYNITKVNGTLTVKDTTAPTISLSQIGTVSGVKGWNFGSNVSKDSSGVITVNTGATGSSSYLYDVNNGPWTYYLDFYTTVSGLASCDSYGKGDSCVNHGSAYYDESFNSKVSSNSYSGNGWAPGATALNTWTSANWNGWSASGTKYVVISMSHNNQYTKPVTKYRNIKVTGDLYARDYTINVSTSDLAGVTVRKYASGSQAKSYFTSSGTTFTGNTINVTANGTYTVYVADAAGNSSISTINVSKVDRTAPSITSISYANGKITSTATDSASKIVAYAVTTSSSEPLNWTRVNNTTSSTINYSVSSGGTYYVWFVDGAQNVANTSVSVPTYTITYNMNGGSGSISSQTKVKDIALTLSSTVPIKSGYEFLGWSTSSTATSASYAKGASFTSNANTTLYAIWRKTITITFNANGNTVSASSRSCYAYNSNTSCSITSPTITAPSATPTVIGFATSSTATTSSWNQNTTLTVSSNATYYAITRKDAITRTVSYNANGGSGVPSSQSCTISATYNGVAQGNSCNITISSTTPTRSSYSFTGYNTSSTATSASYAKGTTYSFSSNVTLYAIWKAAYICTSGYRTSVTSSTSSYDYNGNGYICEYSYSYTQYSVYECETVTKPRPDGTWCSCYGFGCNLSVGACDGYTAAQMATCTCSDTTSERVCDNVTKYCSPTCYATSYSDDSLQN